MSDNKKRVDEIVEKIKELVRKGNVSRIMVKRGGELILNVPLNVGILGSLIGGPWALIGAAIGALGLDCKVELEKTDGEVIELFSREVGQKAVDLGGTVIDEIKERMNKE